MALLRYILLLVCTLSATLAAPLDEVVAPAPLADKEDYRLPTTIWPIHYDIYLQPYLLETDGAKRFTFDGEVNITMQSTVITSELKIHSKNLIFQKIEYHEEGSEDRISLSETFFDPDNETDIGTYTMENPLDPNKTYILHVIYNGTMDDDMHGFYRSSYTDSKNVTKWLGSTQFQTNHARRCFPSFDEPKFKATFNVRIKRHKSMKAVSNTNLISSIVEDDYAIDSFNKTPIMSTYLLAFIVSEFNERFDGVFGVLARPEYYHQTEYAFDVGKEILKALDDYLDVPYYEVGPNKMHMAAIPDFSAGAMENWGLLTYRERSLLVDNDFTSLSSKQSIAAVIAHEQAHMWFGDLVTCDWWSVTWLNEGFARFFQYFATSWVEKHYQIDEQFVVAQVQSVMGMDSTNSTNPMTDPNTYTPSDLSRMFNSISYNKGATVIRMVEKILGENVFRQSLQEYLKNNTYKTTVPETLFKHWKEHWPQIFESYADSFLESYTTQVGYPVVTFNKSGTTVTVSQKRFLLRSDDGSDDKLLYTVPITYTHSAENNFENTYTKFFLPQSGDSVTLTVPQNLSWIIANIQEVGYYRVNYDEASWHGIHHALYENNWSGIHDLNRAQIVDDLFNLARAGEIEYSLALSILEYLETETHYNPWTAAFNGFSYLAIRLGVNTDNFGWHIRQLTEKAYMQLGFDESVNDTALDIYNRANILSWSCKYGNSECVSKANSIFHTYHMGGAEVPVNIRSVVYCSTMRIDSGHHFDILYEKYLTETVATEETLILNSLGCVKDSTLVERFFNITLGDTVRLQDKSSALSSLYTSNNENVWPVYELVTNRYHEVATAMGGYSAVASVISGLASRFTEESQKSSLQTFISQHGSDFGTSVATLNAAVNTVSNNLEWSKQRLGTFIDYLDLRANSSPISGPFTILTVVLMAAIAMFLR